MASKLDTLQEELSRRGGDPLRLQCVEAARRFKRSWLEMAEALTRLRASEAYLQWGYGDIHEYCGLELQLKKGTVDKLLGSFSTLTTHAPQVLQRDGVHQSIPTIDAVDYFAKALRSEPANEEQGAEHPAEVMEDLHKAVFDDVQPVAVLRRTFNPILHPKPEGADELAALEKAMSMARRLEALVPTLDGVEEARATEVAGILSKLREDLEALIPAARDRLAS